MLIYPSILTLDFSQLESQIKAAVAGGADGIHVDVMDGQFVPQITFGTPIIKAINSVTNLPLDIHMMVIEPDRFFADFADAGAKSITVHFEAVEDIEQTLAKLDSLGVNKSLALNPQTEIEKSFPYLAQLEQILIMSVNPGYGGQSFIESSLQKIDQVKNQIIKQGLSTNIQVDGGINRETISAVAHAGADIVVAGSVVFGPNKNPTEGIQLLKKNLES